MMKSEFENLAGRAVTNEQYRAIETLYMSSNLEKAEFVKSIRTMLKSIPQPERKKDIKRMVVRDRSGYRMTPNGCYYHIEYPTKERVRSESVSQFRRTSEQTSSNCVAHPTTLSSMSKAIGRCLDLNIRYLTKAGIRYLIKTENRLQKGVCLILWDSSSTTTGQPSGSQTLRVRDAKRTTSQSRIKSHGITHR